LEFDKSITGEIKLPLLVEKLGASNSAQVDPECAVDGPEREDCPPKTDELHPVPVVVHPDPVAKSSEKDNMLLPGHGDAFELGNLV
jgi:hypothetical protein